jgi:hypothetical protein
MPMICTTIWHMNKHYSISDVAQRSSGGHWAEQDPLQRLESDLRQSH